MVPCDTVQPVVLGKPEEDFNAVWICIKTGNCDRMTHSPCVRQIINLCLHEDTIIGQDLRQYATPFLVLISFPLSLIQSSSLTEHTLNTESLQCVEYPDEKP